MVLIKVVLILVREIDVPNGKTLSVFLRKHWATGREVKEVVELCVGLA